MATLKKRLFVGMCVLIGLQAPALLFSEGRGFFFNASGVLDFAPSMAQGRGETIYGDLAGIGGLIIGAGYNFSSWEVSLNTGWGMNTQYPAYDEAQSDGSVIRRFQQTANHEIPLFVKGVYRIGLGKSFTLKPNLFTGVLFTVSPEYDAARNWVDDPVPGVCALKFGGGVDFAFAFPGEKVSIFAGVDFSAAVDLTNTERWVLSPAIRGGVVFYPFSRANKYSPKDVPRSDGVKKAFEPTPLLKGPDKKKVNIVAKSTGPTEDTVPVVLVEAPTKASGSVLLAAVRGQVIDGATISPVAARPAGQAGAVARAQTPTASAPAAAATPARQPTPAPAGSGTAARSGANSSSVTNTGSATNSSSTTTINTSSTTRTGPLSAEDLIRDINAMKADVSAIKTELEALD